MNKLYSFYTARNIIVGCNSLNQIGSSLKLSGVKRAGVVTDQGILKAGISAELEKILRDSGIVFEVFPDVLPEPPLENIERLANKMREKRFDILIGIGGGSSLDVTKLVSATFTNDQPLEEYFGIDRIKNRGVPTVLVPTTAGTGSEVTPNAIVTISEQWRKAGIVSRHLLPDYAVLDPSLTISLPPASTAATGIDALIHCLESYIGKKANPLSDTFALEGIRLISAAIHRTYTDGQDLESREKMLLGSMYGGMALTSAGTAAVHALAYPIGARYGIPHGIANSMLLVPVLEFSLDSCSERLSAVADVMGVDSSSMGNVEKAEWVLGRLKALICDLRIPDSLKPFGCEESHLDDLSAAASEVKRLLDNNPKAMSLRDIKNIYRRLLG